MTTVPTIGLDIRFGFDAAGARPAALQLLTGGGWPPTQPRPERLSGNFGQEPSRRGNQARSERVAQTVEHVTFNHGVLGSIPSALTNEIKLLASENRSSDPRALWFKFSLRTHAIHRPMILWIAVG